MSRSLRPVSMPLYDMLFTPSAYSNTVNLWWENVGMDWFPVSDPKYCGFVYTVSVWTASKIENCQKKQLPVILKIAEGSTASSVGFGTYFGLILVFLRSKPISDVPLGKITPPFTLLNL